MPAGRSRSCAGAHCPGHRSTCPAPQPAASLASFPPRSLPAEARTALPLSAERWALSSVRAMIAAGPEALVARLVLPVAPVPAPLVYPRLARQRLASPRRARQALAFRKRVLAGPAFPARARPQPRCRTKQTLPQPASLALAVGLSDPAPPSVRQTFRPAAALVLCANHVLAAWNQGSAAPRRACCLRPMALHPVHCRHPPSSRGPPVACSPPVSERLASG